MPCFRTERGPPQHEERLQDGEQCEEHVRCKRRRCGTSYPMVACYSACAQVSESRPSPCALRLTCASHMLRDSEPPHVDCALCGQCMRNARRAVTAPRSAGVPCACGGRFSVRASFFRRIDIMQLDARVNMSASIYTKRIDAMYSQDSRYGTYNHGSRLIHILVERTYTQTYSRRPLLQSVYRIDVNFGSLRS